MFDSELSVEKLLQRLSRTWLQFSTQVQTKWLVWINFHSRSTLRKQKTDLPWHVTPCTGISQNCCTRGTHRPHCSASERKALVISKGLLHKQMTWTKNCRYTIQTQAFMGCLQLGICCESPVKSSSSALRTQVILTCSEKWWKGIQAAIWQTFQVKFG